MKVLKNNYNQIGANSEEIRKFEPYPRKLLCEHCSSELEYEESDLRMGEYGCMFVDCPCCGQDNMLEENEHNITLTVDNIEFPTHFSRTSTEHGAVDCCNNGTIKEYLRKAIDYFRKNKDEYDWGGHITGNLYLHVHRWSGDENYEITISNNFYSMDIPFEDIDY
jgi:hypothetical protein